MKSHFWTTAEIQRMLELRGAGYSCRDVATMLQRPEATIRNKLLALGYTTRRISDIEAAEPSATLPLPSPRLSGTEPTNISRPDPTPLEAKAEAMVENQLRRQRERVELDDAKQAVLEDRLYEALSRHWETHPPRIEVPIMAPVSQDVAITPCAVVIISDAHIGKTVDPDEVPILGTYNPAVAVDRTAFLESVLIENLRRHPVDQLFVIFAGDMIEGHLGHALQDNLTAPIALQFDLALSLFAQFVLRLAAHAPKTRVFNVTGNHGRMLGERRMPSTGRWSNFDGLLYRALCGWVTASGADHIHFDRSICSRLRIAAPHHVIQVQHGDEIRGGTYGSTGLNREYLHASMRSFHTGEAPPDILILGDKHISAQIPVGPGQCIYNGSFVGVDAYSMGFSPSRPSQTMLYLHPERHETHVVLLDNLPPDLVVPYRFQPDLEKFLNQYRHEK